MSFKIELPPSFEEQLQESLKEMYSASIEQARRDYSMSKEILSIHEVMKWTSSSRNTVMLWGKMGLPISKIEGKYFIRKSHLLKFIDDHQIN